MLEQTVLAVFRPRPGLPLPVQKSPKDTAARERDSTTTTSPVSVEDWSILSLLLSPKTSAEWIDGAAPSVGGSGSSGPMLEACPVASRSAIHVLHPVATPGVGISNNGPVHPDSEAPDAAKETCGSGGTPDDLTEACRADTGTELSCEVCGYISRPGTVVTTRLLSPRGDGVGDNGEGEHEEGTISEYLQAKLWGEADVDNQESDATLDMASKMHWATSQRRSTFSDPNPSVMAGAAAASSTETLALLDHFLAGRGGTRGVSVAHLVNLHPTADAQVQFLQVVPFFMVPLLGTLQARLMPSGVSSFSPSGGTGSQQRSSTRIFPAEDRATSSGESDEAMAMRDTADGQRIHASRDGWGTEVLSGDPVIGPTLTLADNITFTPGEGRRPAVVEVLLWIPAGSTLVLGYDFFKRFLSVEDFPPDPSRGFDVPPPLARFEFSEGDAPIESRKCGDARGHLERSRMEFSPDDGTDVASCRLEEGSFVKGMRHTLASRVVYAYGEAGLMDTPQPDFSMPFNVITFTSTVITFFLGTAINLIVRKNATRKDRRKKKHADGQGGEGDNDELVGGTRARRWGGLLPRLWQNWVDWRGKPRKTRTATREA